MSSLKPKSDAPVLPAALILGPILNPNSVTPISLDPEIALKPSMPGLCLFEIISIPSFTKALFKPLSLTTSQTVPKATSF